MLEFLSPEWIEQAHARIRDHATPIEGEHVLVFEHEDDDLGTIVHSQRWTDKRLSAWLPSRAEDADATVRLELWAAYMWIFGRLPVATTLDVIDSSGNTWSVPPTSKQLARTSSSRTVRGLTLTAHVTVTDHPFGEQTRTYRFIDGIAHRDDQDGNTKDPYVSISVPFDGGGSFLLGGLPFWDIASRSSISGDVLLFGNLAGLLAPPEVMRVHSAAHRAMALATEALTGLHSLRPLIYDLEAHTIVP